MNLVSSYLSSEDDEPVNIPKSSLKRPAESAPVRKVQIFVDAPPDLQAPSKQAREHKKLKSSLFDLLPEPVSEIGSAEGDGRSLGQGSDGLNARISIPNRKITTIAQIPESVSLDRDAIATAQMETSEGAQGDNDSVDLFSFCTNSLI